MKWLSFELFATDRNMWVLDKLFDLTQNDTVKLVYPLITSFGNISTWILAVSIFKALPAYPNLSGTFVTTPLALNVAGLRGSITLFRFPSKGK